MPSPDIRVKASIRTSLKWVRLRSECGPDGQLSLLYLWLWAREHRPEGDLHGLSDTDLESVAGWVGESGAFATALRRLCWIDDDDENGVVLHNWEEHNQWAAEEEKRSKVARENAIKGWETRRGRAKNKPKKRAKSRSKATANDSQSHGNAPLSTSPLPSPHSEGGRGGRSAATPRQGGFTPPRERTVAEIAAGMHMTVEAFLTTKQGDEREWYRAQHEQEISA